MKENYKSWEVDYEDFYNQKTILDQLRFLLKFAVLAPSAQNNQPWRFRVGNNFIEIMPQFKRALLAGDANHRQLFISLGCCLENLLVAADYYGFRFSLEYFPNGQDAEVVVRVNFARSETDRKNNLAHPIFSIPKRHTNRSKYLSYFPDERFLRWAGSLSDNGLRVDLVGGALDREKVANLAIKAGKAAMRDVGFRKEIAGFMRSNSSMSKFGMPGFVLGIKWLPSLLAPYLMKYFNLPRLTEKRDSELLLNHTPLFGIISTQKDNKQNWLRVGQIFEKISLAGLPMNIRLAPLSAVVQTGEYYREIQKILKIDWRPQFFFRMGYCPENTRHTPRFSVGELVE